MSNDKLTNDMLVGASLSPRKINCFFSVLAASASRQWENYFQQN